MKIFIVFNFLLVLLVACNQTDKSTSKPKLTAEELCLKAYDYIATNPDSALILLDQAIDVDKNYDKAYSTKTAIYIQEKDYKKALAAAEKVVSLKPNCAECFLSAAMLNEKMGKTKKANEYYQKCIDIFDSKIADPNLADKVNNNKINRILALFMLDKKAEANSEIEKFKAENPDNTRINMYDNFDKNEFISTIFNE